MSLGSVTRGDVEDFLIREAWLLDNWRLEEWLRLFLPGSRYLMPSTDLAADADTATSLYLISDDYAQLQFRVKRLFHPQGHAEQPHSRTQRLISNVMLDGIVDDVLDVKASFLIARSRNEITDWLVGHYANRLVLDSGELRFLERKAVLGLPALRPIGTASIIV